MIQPKMGRKLTILSLAAGLSVVNLLGCSQSDRRGFNAGRPLNLAGERVLPFQGRIPEPTPPRTTTPVSPQGQGPQTLTSQTPGGVVVNLPGVTNGPRPTGVTEQNGVSGSAAGTGVSATSVVQPAPPITVPAVVIDERGSLSVAGSNKVDFDTDLGLALLKIMKDWVVVNQEATESAAPSKQQVQDAITKFVTDGNLKLVVDNMKKHSAALTPFISGLNVFKRMMTPAEKARYDAASIARAQEQQPPPPPSSPSDVALRLQTELTVKDLAKASQETNNVLGGEILSNFKKDRSTSTGGSSASGASATNQGGNFGPFSAWGWADVVNRLHSSPVDWMSSEVESSDMFLPTARVLDVLMNQGLAALTNHTSISSDLVDDVRLFHVCRDVLCDRVVVVLEFLRNNSKDGQFLESFLETPKAAFLFEAMSEKSDSESGKGKRLLLKAATLGNNDSAWLANMNSNRNFSRFMKDL